MRRDTFFILALMVAWIGMIIWSFFGGWEEESTITPHENTGFIQQLNETWSIETWENIANVDQNTSQEKSQTNIRVMMPTYFYNQWWKTFAQDLYKDQKVYIDFVFIDDLNEYRDRIYKPEFNGADLVLIPYDRANEISTRSVSFSSEIWSYFDSLISPSVNDSKVSFVPFSVDPLIMYTLSWNSVPRSFLDFWEYIYNYTPTRSLSIPLRFGLSSEDYDEWYSREYQDIVWYALMHYFSTYRDSKSLQSRVDSNVLESYNIRNIQTIINAIDNHKCKDFPSICLQLYNFVSIRFWFLSDADIVKHYFQNYKSEFEKITKSTLPFSSSETPVRLRWRALPSSITDISTINSVYLFLIHYMNNHSKYNLRNSTLPAFHHEWDATLSSNKFVWDKWYILSSWWNYIEDSRAKRYFRQLIEYQISAKDYLRKI